jgi:hypothetical protein
MNHVSMPGGSTGGGYPWYAPAGAVLAGIAVMGLAGWLIGPQGGDQPSKQQHHTPHKSQQGGLRLEPKEGNFILPRGDSDSEDEDSSDGIVPFHLVPSSLLGE